MSNLLRYAAAGLLASGCRPSTPTASHSQPAPTSDPKPSAEKPSPALAPPKIAPDAPPGMVRLPAGKARVGYNHTRYFPVDAFFYDIHETTVAEYWECVHAKACSAPGARQEVEARPSRCTGGRKHGLGYPINCITQIDARAYCKWRKKRLPDEFEWAWAFGGGDEYRINPWGEASVSCEFANIGNEFGEEEDAIGNIGRHGDGCGHEGPWPVGTAPKGVSRHGLHDLVGNVAEWTSSMFGELSGRTGNGKVKIAVGGSWWTRRRDSFRAEGSALTEDTWGHGTGVRCAMDIDAWEPPPR